MDKFDFSCGYCKLLECGGSISSEKTFFTIFDRLLCGLTSGIVDCLTPQQVLPNSSFRVPSQEEIDGFLSLLGGTPSDTAILPATLPIGYVSPVLPLPPGKTEVWKVAVLDLEVNSSECEEIDLFAPAFISSTGPDPLPIDLLNPNGAFGAILLTDSLYTNVFGLTAFDFPLAVNDWRPNALYAAPVPPGSYKIFIVLVVNSGSLSGPWECGFRYGISNIFLINYSEFFPSAFNNTCPPKALSVSLCNPPSQTKLYKTTPIKLCDNDTPFLRHYSYDPEGVLFNFFDTDINGFPYFVNGDVSNCPSGPSQSRISYFNTDASSNPTTVRATLTEGQNAVRVWIGETPRNESDFILYVKRNSTVIEVLVHRWSAPVVLVPSGAGTTLAFGTSDGRQIGITPLSLPASFPVSSGISGTANADLATVPIWSPSAAHVTLQDYNSAIEIQGSGWGVAFLSEFDGAQWSPARSIILNGTYPIKELCTYKQIALATYNGATLSVSAPTGSIIGGTKNVSTFGIVPTGTTYNVTANSGADLLAKMALAVSGDRILLPAGTYTLPSAISAATFAANILAGNIGGEGVIIQGATGNRADVILKPAASSGAVNFTMPGATDPFLWRDLTWDFSGSLSSLFFTGGKIRLENIRVFGPQTNDSAHGCLVGARPDSTAIVDFQALNCIFEDAIGDVFSGSVQASGTFQSASICKLYNVTAERAGNVDDTRQCFTTHSGFANELYSCVGSDARLNVVANDSNANSISYIFFSRFTNGTRRNGVSNHYSWFNYYDANNSLDAWNPQNDGWSIGNRIQKINQIFSSSVFNNVNVKKITANYISMNDGRGSFVRAGAIENIRNVFSGCGEGVRKDNFLGPSTAAASDINNTFIGCVIGWTSTIANFITNFKNNAAKTSGTSVSVNATANGAMTKNNNVLDPTVGGSYTAGSGDTLGVDAALDSKLLPTLGGNCDDNGLASTFTYVGAYDFEQFVHIYKAGVISRGARS